MEENGRKKIDNNIFKDHLKKNLKLIIFTITMALSNKLDQFL